MFDFMAICDDCGRKDLGSTWGKGTSTCEGCWRMTESPVAKFCEHCANRKGRCKFCKADLNEEFHRITGGKYRRPTAQPAQEPQQALEPLPKATLLGARPTVPSWIVTTVLAALSLAFAYAGYWFLVLRY